MAKYKVCYEVCSYLYAEVEADSPEEAYEIADMMDGGEFEENVIETEWNYIGAIDMETKVHYDKYGDEIW